MRRYGQQTQRVTVPGRDAGLKLTLQPAVNPIAQVEPCAPDISGLFWFSDATGLFDQDVETAYLLDTGAAGPVLAVAGLLGENCDLPVIWIKDWTPANGSGGNPGYFEDGARLVVYPLADTEPGVLEVSAEHDGQTASLIGELSGGTVRWIIETEYGMRVDNVSMGPHSPDFSADISISANENYSVLTVTATVVCGEATAGPFSIYFYLWKNT